MTFALVLNSISSLLLLPISDSFHLCPRSYCHFGHYNAFYIYIFLLLLLGVAFQENPVKTTTAVKLQLRVKWKTLAFLHISRSSAIKSASNFTIPCYKGDTSTALHKNTATRLTLHQIRLSTLTSSYRHLANSFTFVNDATHTVCRPGISVGVEFPPLHIYLSVFR